MFHTVALYPGQHDAVTFVHMGHIAPGGHYHSGRFMPQHQGPRQGRIVYLVELRVAYASGKLFDDDVRGARLANIQVINHQPPTNFQAKSFLFLVLLFGYEAC